MHRMKAPGTGCRVLHLGTGNLFGGVESLLLTLARHRQVEPAVDVHFSTCFPGRLRDELGTTGSPAHRLPSVRMSRPWQILEARRCLAELVRRHQFDVLISHSAWVNLVFGPVLLQPCVPRVDWFHEVSLNPVWWEKWARRRPAALTLLNSQHTASRLEKRYATLKHEVLYYPVDPPPVLAVSDRLDARRELGAGDEDVVIMIVCRMEAWKGHLLLIEALGQLCELSGWKCWVVGGAQRPAEQVYLQTLERKAAAAGIANRICFTGQRRDVYRLLAGADIHCQPNLGPEPFGIVFIEALYSGLPVISTNLGGAAEIVTPACGVLTAPENSAALATALRGLILDPARRKSLGQGGPARARTLCDPIQQISRLNQHLRRLAESGRQ